jgi:hypothetical protein
VKGTVPDLLLTEWLLLWRMAYDTYFFFYFAAAIKIVVPHKRHPPWVPLKFLLYLNAAINLLCHTIAITKFLLYRT